MDKRYPANSAEEWSSTDASCGDPFGDNGTEKTPAVSLEHSKVKVCAVFPYTDASMTDVFHFQLGHQVIVHMLENHTLRSTIGCP